MLARIRERSGNGNVSPVVVVIAVAVLLAFIGWQAYINLFAPPRPAPMDAKGRANRAVLAALAKKCQGDMSKLSPDDQAQARKMAGGHAGMVIAMLYKNPNMGDE